MLEFGFEFQNIQAKLMMKPTSICHIFREFDPSSENVLITVTKDYISFYTKGDLGQIKVRVLISKNPFRFYVDLRKLLLYVLFSTSQLCRLNQNPFYILFNYTFPSKMRYMKHFYMA